MQRPSTSFPFLFLGLFLAGCSAKYPQLLGPPQSDRSVCLLHGRVLLGPELSSTDDTDLCFTDGRIVSIAGHAQAAPVAGARLYDVRGQTVLPGLIDTHVHAIATEAPPWRMRRPSGSHNLAAWLHAGITTVYDMGGPPAELHKLQAELEAQTLVGPHLLHAHEPFTAPGGHPIPAIKALLPWPFGWLLARQVKSVAAPADAAALVQAAKSRGAQYIKIIHDSLPPGAPELDAARLSALVAAAHAEGLKVFVHIGSNRDALDAVAAGADHLAHGVYREAVSDEVIAALASHHIGVTYTAAGFDNTRRMAAGEYAPDGWARATSAPELVSAVSGPAGAEFGRTPVVGDFARGIVSGEELRRNIARLHAGGVRIFVGTDSPVAAVFPGGSFHEELALLHAAGIPRSTLLRRATVEAAGLVSAAPDFGQLAVGMRADVLVVSGDPQAELAALRHIQHVFVGGRELPRLVQPEL